MKVNEEKKSAMNLEDIPLTKDDEMIRFSEMARVVADLSDKMFVSVMESLKEKMPEVHNKIDFGGLLTIGYTSLLSNRSTVVRATSNTFDISIEEADAVYGILQSIKDSLAVRINSLKMSEDEKRIFKRLGDGDVAGRELKDVKMELMNQVNNLFNVTEA